MSHNQTSRRYHDINLHRSLFVRVAGSFVGCIDTAVGRGVVTGADVVTGTCVSQQTICVKPDHPHTVG